MPRRNTLNHTIECDRDLTRLSNSRITIHSVGINRYQFKSRLRFYCCEIASFVQRFIYSRLGRAKWVVGTCSRPDGYRFD